MNAARASKTLATESYINLATFRRNGAVVETPVWFAILDGKLYVVTDGTSAKVKRIRATKRVRVAPCNIRGGVTGQWLDGKARIVGEKKLVERAHAALQEKYGWQMGLLDTVSQLFGRIGRRAYLELSLGRVVPLRRMRSRSTRHEKPRSQRAPGRQRRQPRGWRQPGRGSTVTRLRPARRQSRPRRPGNVGQ